MRRRRSYGRKRVDQSHGEYSLNVVQSNRFFVDPLIKFKLVHCIQKLIDPIFRTRISHVDGHFDVHNNNQNDQLAII